MRRLPLRPNLSFLDFVTFFSLLLDIGNSLKLNKQSSNDNLLKELNKDTDALIGRLKRIEEKMDEYLPS